MKIRPKLIIISTAAVMVLVSATLLFFDKPRYALEMLYERPRIEKALRAYFAAEMNRDYEKVFKCLAPSSQYRMTHDYDEFLADMENGTVKIVKYEVMEIYGLRPNHDLTTYPDVQRFAQAEVDITLEDTQTKTTGLYNYSFTFLREGGTWFKG
ncbi:MAG TPA: nuclear transport factor 2 family protein [Deltaproteobacteria bacterium]|nr:nuclear transport factor 2 family protein [Deltaproteobacteria bacterium]